MTKPPRLATTEEMESLSAKEDLAKGTIGAAVVQLVRAGQTVTWPAIVAVIDADASAQKPLAIGAQRFIATLPSNKAD